MDANLRFIVPPPEVSRAHRFLPYNMERHRIADSFKKKRKKTCKKHDSSKNFEMLKRALAPSRQREH